MNGTLDSHSSTTEHDDDLDPQAAAALLQETGARAKRSLDLNGPPFMPWLGAALFLVIYGGLYMAARGQHPYTGPKGPWLLVWPFGIVASLVINGGRYDRMKRTLSGATLRRVRASGAVVAVGLIGIYAIDIGLNHAGAGKSIVVGSFDAVAPIIILGTIGAANAAWREDWPAMGVSMALILVAGGASFAGPADSWGVIAIGGCVSCLGLGVVKEYLRRTQRG